MDYAADDKDTIQRRIREIAAENTPVLDRLDSLHNFDLDTVGANHDVPRGVGEADYAYRYRIKVKLDLI